MRLTFRTEQGRAGIYRRASGTRFILHGWVDRWVAVYYLVYCTRAPLKMIKAHENRSRMLLTSTIKQVIIFQSFKELFKRYLARRTTCARFLGDRIFFKVSNHGTLDARMLETDDFACPKRSAERDDSKCKVQRGTNQKWWV